MLKQTGITFGGTLRASDLNTLNDTINQVVTAVNGLLRDRVNVNIEILGTQEKMTLSQARDLVPKGRRIPGLTLKYNDTDYGWTEWVWSGETWDTGWTRPGVHDTIDGGKL